MGITNKSNPLQAYDGRLKILWIDDDYENLAPREVRDYREWFSLTYIHGTDDVQQLLEAAKTEAVIAEEFHPVYALPLLPFDVYLTDFRLCDKKNEGCKDQAHLESGLHAPSVGFLLGILTALRSADHPQAIIPYSAYDDEFGQIWKLISKFCPPSLRVLWDESVAKGLRNQNQLINLVSVQYRESLLAALQDSDMHIPFGNRERWERRLEEAGEFIDAKEMIWFVGAYGERPFSLGALFREHLDLENLSVPKSVVAEWLLMVPTADPVEKAARSLTEFFWRMRCSRLSQDKYSMIHEMNKGKIDNSDLPPALFSVDWLCIWKRSNDNDGHRPIRLAILYLLLHEHAARVRKPLPTKARHLLESIFKLRSQFSTIEELLTTLEWAANEQNLKEDFQDALGEIIGINRDKDQDGGVKLWYESPFSGDTEEYRPWVTEGDVVKLLNPLPDGWDVKLSLDKSAKIGKELSRLSPPLDVRRLLNGDGSQLSNAEKESARKYARELMPNETNWPGWLKR